MFALGLFTGHSDKMWWICLHDENTTVQLQTPSEVQAGLLSMSRTLRDSVFYLITATLLFPYNEVTHTFFCIKFTFNNSTTQ